MTGITDLPTLLASMEPELQPGEFVFCSIPAPVAVPQSIDFLGMFLEKEGRTLIVRADDAPLISGVVSSPMRCITLTVHSSLDAVGLTAAFATALTRHNISANVIAAYYHDHIFVAPADAERAVEVLKALSKSSAAG